MAKIAIILNTARTEEETPYANFQEMTDGNVKVTLDVEAGFTQTLWNSVFPDDKTFLDGTLRSLMRQTMTDFEVIIVDRRFEDRKNRIEEWKPVVDYNIVHIPDNHFDDLLGKHPLWEKGYPCPSRSRNAGYIACAPDTELVVHVTDLALFSPVFLERTMHWWTTMARGMKGIRELWVTKDGQPECVATDEHSGDMSWTWDKQIGSMDYTVNWDCRSLWAHAAVVPLKDALELNGWNESMDGVIDAEDIEFGFRLWDYGTDIVWDRKAKIYELDGPRSGSTLKALKGNKTKKLEDYDSALRINHFWLDYFGKELGRPDAELRPPVVANSRRPLKIEIDKFHEYQERRCKEQGLGIPNNPDNYLICDIPTFDLKDIRQKYWLNQPK